MRVVVGAVLWWLQLAGGWSDLPLRKGSCDNWNSMAAELFNRRTSNMKKTLNFKLLKPFIDFADVLWGRRVELACHAA